MAKKTARIGIILFLIIIGAFGAAHFTGFYFDHRDFSIGKKTIFGASYRQDAAKYFGLNPREVAFAMLDDLKIKYIRLIIPWDEIEYRGSGQFDFSFFDWFIKEAEKRNAKLIVNIGQRTAGWPEFHFPSWVLRLPEQNRKDVPPCPFFNWHQLGDVEKIYNIKLKVPDPDFLNIEISAIKVPVIISVRLSIDFCGKGSTAI